MAVVIRLQRTGKPGQAHFRVVAIEKARGAQGKPLEVLGSYNPGVESPTKRIQLKKERYERWLKNGALPSETVSQLVKAAGRSEAAPAPPQAARG